MEAAKSAEIAEALVALSLATTRAKSALAGIHPLDIRYGLRDGAYDSIPLFEVLRESLKLSRATEASAQEMIAMLPERVRRGRSAKFLGGAIRSLSRAGAIRPMWPSDRSKWHIVREKL